MSEVKVNLPFPLDEDGFLKRKCPLCYREFKVFLEEEELTDLAQKGIDSFILEKEEEETNLDKGESSRAEFVCPYCGQQTPSDSWWTQKQLAYLRIIAKNIMAKVVNENSIHPLKRTFQKSSPGIVSIRFEGRGLEQEEPWVFPEINLGIFDLPCCQRKIKIEENWQGKVHCFFCGFPHKNRRNRGV